jgi:Tuberin
VLSLLKYVYLDTSDSTKSSDFSLDEPMHARKLQILQLLCSISVDGEYRLCLVSNAGGDQIGSESATESIPSATEASVANVEGLTVSPYLRARNPPEATWQHEHLYSAILPFGDVFNAFTYVLNHDADMRVLYFVLQALQRFLLLRRPLVEVSTSCVETLAACVARQARTREFALRSTEESKPDVVQQVTVLWFDVLCSLIGYARTHLNPNQARQLSDALAFNVRVRLSCDEVDSSRAPPHVVAALDALQERIALRCLRGLTVAAFECPGEFGTPRSFSFFPLTEHFIAAVVAETIRVLCEKRSLTPETCSCVQAMRPEHVCGLDVAALEFVSAVTHRPSALKILSDEKLSVDIFTYLVMDVIVPSLISFPTAVTGPACMRSTAVLGMCIFSLHAPGLLTPFSLSSSALCIRAVDLCHPDVVRTQRWLDTFPRLCYC